MADDGTEPKGNAAPQDGGAVPPQSAGDVRSPTLRDADPNVPGADPQPARQLLAFSFTGSAGEYFRIWVVNTCLTLLTTARYRADRFKVFLSGDLSQFRANTAPPVRAAGAELGEFFDLDFSL